MSQKIKNLTARLSAVQALYQASQNKQPLNALIEEYLEHRVSMEVDGEEVVQMDGALFKRIVEGVYARSAELEGVIVQNTKNQAARMESLLKSILLCGIFEIMAHDEVDSPILINDYLNISHSFYGDGEVSLVNGVLDTVAKSFRNSAL